MRETENLRPEEIEARSFEIIGELLGDRPPDPEHEHIIRRVIHTTADFDYVDSLYFSPEAGSRIRQALREGASVVTDTRMAQSGINRKALGGYGGEVHCFIGEEDTAREARSRGVTRAAVSMEMACSLEGPLVFAIGNAPTALIRLKELIEEGRIRPAGIIAVPVGFVNVVESKEQILSLEGIPLIVARGRKGGSNVAAAIVNAILYSKD